MPTVEPTSAVPATASRRTWRTALNALAVRLRFPAILAVAFLIVGKWDVLRNYWDTWTRAAVEDNSAYKPVSNDTEYFCPMDPGVVSDWPSKCGICNMTLVRRKRGEATALPEGVVARMQLTPYRIQLAGVRTALVGYRPLVAETEADGAAEVRERTETLGRRVVVHPEFSSRDARRFHEGQGVLATCDELPGHEPFQGSILSLSQEPTIAIQDPQCELRDAMMLRVRVQRVVAELEPFSSLPSDPPPLQKGEPRTVHSCPDHPDNLGKRGGRCPLDRLELESRILAVNQRLRWWCPMHPEVTADRPGLQCDACGGMVLRPRVITYRPRGEVLAVPDSAVVDTGKRQVVFVERMPGMFEGVKVTLGERCGDWYPVVRGVESGQLVVVAGAFLLDAETRLDPSLAATYFGAGRIAPAQVDHGSERPSSHDRGAADRQAFCPVTRKPLGSMGTPVKVVVDGRTVFLCCQGCEERLRKDPKRFLEAAATPRP